MMHVESRPVKALAHQAKQNRRGGVGLLPRPGAHPVPDIEEKPNRVHRGGAHPGERNSSALETCGLQVDPLRVYLAAPDQTG
jgi:hypothetical protein